jgi:flagellin
MGMVVRTNMGAINANNALTKNNSTVNKNIEKLSSGFRINRAADDASGLAISEKMKAQIKALDTATSNAEDGISLIQTAEGYMGEIHDMLNRIVELAEKSANGTYQTNKKTDGTYDAAKNEDFTYGGNEADTASVKTGVDRQALQDEVNQLCAEIDRIATTANFNGMKIMDGTMDVNNASRANISVSVTGTGANVKTLVGITSATTGSALRLQIGETSGVDDRLEVNVKSFKTNQLFAELGIKFTTVSGAATAASTAALTGSDGKTLVASNAVTGSVGGKSKNTNGVTLNISNQASAAKIAESVRDIINDVSSQRAELGAMQNRLDYTINNLTTASENISSANSRIRDTDMAKEMMKYTQGNVLTQAAQAMLAQANQAPQSVLQLLQ